MEIFWIPFVSHAFDQFGRHIAFLFRGFDFAEFGLGKIKVLDIRAALDDSAAIAETSFLVWTHYSYILTRANNDCRQAGLSQNPRVLYAAIRSLYPALSLARDNKACRSR